MTREQILARLEQEYARRREDNLRLFEQRREEACGRCPGLRELLDKRHAEVMAGVRSSLTAPRRGPGANAGLPGAHGGVEPGRSGRSWRRAVWPPIFCSPSTPAPSAVTRDMCMTPPAACAAACGRSSTAA